ncbi:hypothetical protein [Actinomyces wuliandei]|uniref:hypothetical protein n=1 Tax=Actinomyces wuliandei TaxID=2057743 RepID=UPI00111AB4C7|nr:hypothetical protein [Actinomyces wuliandei]
MDDIIIGILEELFSFDTDHASGLSDSLRGHNAQAYDWVISLHDRAVVPVSSVVISIILVLELARNATHIEGDQQMGVRIIAGTMFKSALLVVAAQNSMLFLDAINEVSSAIITGMGEIDKPELPVLPAGIEEDVKDAGDVDKAGMLVLLIIPFLVSLIARIVVQVMVVLRFAELYMLTAFASLPIALLGHPDTKSMGVGYLQRYASVGFHGAAIMLAIQIYGYLMQDVISFPAVGDSELWAWVVANYYLFLLGPAVLIVLIMASGRIAKAVVGQ